MAVSLANEEALMTCSLPPEPLHPVFPLHPSPHFATSSLLPLEVASSISRVRRPLSMAVLTTWQNKGIRKRLHGEEVTGRKDPPLHISLRTPSHLHTLPTPSCARSRASSRGSLGPGSRPTGSCKEGAGVTDR